MKLLKVILFYILSLFSVEIDCYELRKTLLKKFTQCVNETNLPIVLSNTYIHQENKGFFYLDGKFVIKYDMPETWIFKSDYYKCTDSQNLDSCEIYMDKLKVDDGCSVMKAMSEHYFILFESINPKLECPFKAGNYTIKNCFLNMYLESFLTRVPTLTIIIKAEGFEGKKKLFCVDAKIDIINREVLRG